MIHITILIQDNHYDEIQGSKFSQRNKNSVMSNSCSCCIFNAFRFKTNRKNSKYNILNWNYSVENYSLILFKVKEWKKSYVDCLLIAFNFELISFLLNLLIS